MDRDLLLRRICPFAAASLLFALVAALWCAGVTGLYYGIIGGWGIVAHISPFLDTDTVLSAVRCRQMGVDVYVTNPCDQLHRVYDYSPLWLVIARVPGLGNWLTPIGVGCDLLFLVSLLCLPPGRTRGDALLVAAGVISAAAMFALERGNNDLIIFTLAVLAAELSCRSRGVRLIGYGAALLAGLLKYYPMTVLALATRERPARLFAIAAAAATAVAVFVAIMGHDLARALALIPTVAWIGDGFGSSVSAGGIYTVVATADAPGRLVLQTAMTLAALGIAVWRGTRPALAADLASLSERERAFLLAGAMLMVGCFFTAQNIGYRAIHLILILPALTALRQSAPANRQYSWTLAATLLLLWAEEWRQMIRRLSEHLPADIGFGLQIGTWLFREALWWWTITAIAGFAVSLLVRSEAGEAMLGLLPRRAGRAVPA